VQASRHADVPSLKLLQTPAHIAAFAGHAYCLQWLLNHGSDPSRWVKFTLKMILHFKFSW